MNKLLSFISRETTIFCGPYFSNTFKNSSLFSIAIVFTALAGWIIFGIGVGGQQVLTNAGLNVGQVTAFTQYLSLTIAPLALLAIVVPMVLRADTSAERILAVYDDYGPDGVAGTSDDGLPGNRLGMTPQTAVNSSAGHRRSRRLAHHAVTVARYARDSS